MFVMSRSLLGCFRSASLERFPHMDSAEFEQQLVDLLMGQFVRNLEAA